jgi:3-deoxy-D-manno-octulosonate 8-phosphate phosphatase (KDO 8-P phosphatase)
MGTRNPSASFISTIFSRREFDGSVKRISSGLRRKAQNISLLLLDVDGVLTDGRIIIDDRGVETKHFHVRDGQGIALLLRAGIEVGLITSRSSSSVRHRAKELGIRLVYQGVRDKMTTYNEIKRSCSLRDEQIAYMGDDIIDLPTLREVGLALSVADGWSGLRGTVDYVTSRPGGQGAVREVAEMILKAQGKWAGLLEKFAKA